MSNSRALAAALILALGLVGSGAYRAKAADAPHSAPYSWKPAPFGGGGFVDGFVFHPTAPGLLYARTDIGGCYRWDPATKAWIGLNDSLGRDETDGFGCLSLALDPHDPDRVYVAAGEYTGAWAHTAHLLRSRNRGLDWDQVDLPFRLGGNEDGRSMGERLQVDPNDSAVLMLGASKDGLWTSRDYGQSWRRLTALPAASISLVTFDPAGGHAGEATKTLYVGVVRPHGPSFQGPSLYVTHDGGETFAPEAGAPADLTPHHAIFGPKGELYVTFGDGPGPNGVKTGAVWKRDPDGAWHEITPVKPTAETPFGYAGLGVDAQHPGVVVVATLDRWRPGDDVFRSTDGGAHWIALGRLSRQHDDAYPWFKVYSKGVQAMGHWIGALAIDPFDSDHAIYGTGYGLWRTTDLSRADSGQAVDWGFDVEGLEETAPIDIASPPAGPHLLAAVGDVGGAAYEDLKASPSTGLFTPESQTDPSVAFAGRAPLKLVRTANGTPTSGFTSDDGGKTWTPLPATPLVRRDAEGRYHNPGHIALSALGGFMVWAPEREGAFSSKDGGKTWTPSKGWPSAADRSLTPVADPVVEGVFYVNDPTQGQIEISVDGGASFQPAATGLPLGARALALAPGRLRDLWLPTDQGLFHSADPNHPFRNLKHVESADAIGFGMAAPGHDYPTLYLAGRVDGVTGLFRSEDEGASWVRINDPHHQFGWIGQLSGDPRVFGRVYLLTTGRGVMVGEPQ
jgi:photosystem II stability/assembly factor-like uncharacterized protein